MNKDKPETKVVSAGRMSKDHFGAVNTPVYRASTILFPDLASMAPGKQLYTYGRRGTPALAMQINPKSAKTRNTIRRVGNLSGAILSGANRGQNRLHPRFDFRTIQRRVADLLDLSIFANRSRRAVNQQQVAAAATQQLRQKIMQL